MKNIDTKYHFSREHVESNDLRGEYTPTADMIADALIKSVPRQKLANVEQQVGLTILDRVSFK